MLLTLAELRHLSTCLRSPATCPSTVPCTFGILHLSTVACPLGKLKRARWYDALWLHAQVRLRLALVVVSGRSVTNIIKQRMNLAGSTGTSHTEGDRGEAPSEGKAKV